MLLKFDAEVKGSRGRGQSLRGRGRSRNFGLDASLMSK